MSVPTGTTPPGTQPTQGTQPLAGQDPAQSQAQGGGGGTGGGGFNWGLFPDVPEDQRANLEPHLKNVLGHVTRLEQQYAPFKPLVESGIDPGRVQGLANFAQQFQDNPLDTWLGMGAQLQEAGVIHDDLDIQELQAVSQGIDPEAQPGQPPGQGEGDPNGAIPPWAQQMLSEFQQFKDNYTQDQSQRQQRIQDALLDRQLERAKNQLTEAGVQLPEDPEEANRLIVGHVIAHSGNMDQAINAMTGFRETNLQAAVGQRQGQQKQASMPKGPPPAPPRNPEGPAPRDGYAAVRGSAQQYLEQQAAAAAEE